MKTNPQIRHVLLISPGWPPGQVANGIVSTVATKKQAFESLGVRCSVLAMSRQHLAEDQANGVFHVAAFDRWATIRKARTRIKRSVSRLFPSHKRLNPIANDNSRIDGLDEALVHIQKDLTCDLIEMEETFGRSRFVALCSRLPMVVRLHGPWFLNGPANGVVKDGTYQARVAAEGRAIAEASGISSPSSFVLNATEEQYQLGHDNCSAIPNSISPLAENLHWERSAVPSEDILFVGRFDRRKGADVCLRAVQRVFDQYPRATLSFVGPDYGIRDDTGNVQHAGQWINSEVISPKHRSRITICGKLGHREIADLRRKSALTVVPSRFENFPTTVLEAMAQGCPIVASRVGGIPEMIEHEQNGLLCEPGDVDDLATKIISLLDNPAYAARLGRRALQDSLVRYSPTVVAKQEIEFYEEVCTRASRSQNHSAVPSSIRRQ